MHFYCFTSITVDGIAQVYAIADVNLDFNCNANELSTAIQCTKGCYYDCDNRHDVCNYSCVIIKEIITHRLIAIKFE